MEQSPKQFKIGMHSREGEINLCCCKPSKLQGPFVAIMQHSFLTNTQVQDIKKHELNSHNSGKTICSAQWYFLMVILVSNYNLHNTAIFQRLCTRHFSYIISFKPFNNGNTVTAKSLQSCLTLCDPIPGILQARTLEWVAISFSNA